MKKTLWIMQLVCTVLLACGGTPPQDIFMQTLQTGFRSGMYRQDSLMLNDPVGDAYLLRKLDTIPTKLFNYLVHSSLPQVERHKGQPPVKYGTAAPLDVDKLLNSCARIMRESFPDIFPVAGEEHKWSPEAGRYLPRSFWHRLGRRLRGEQQDFPSSTLGCSKLLVCLACGWTSRYCITGTEDALIQAVMSYPDNGVQPHDLFAESYVLNGGNIYLTLLACENILAKMPFRPGRADDEMQRKLCYIRNDPGPHGDNYGAWYHLFGIALYAFMRPPAVSRFVAETESFGSFFYEGSDPQEDIINRQGAEFGARLRSMYEDGTWWLRPAGEDDVDYLLSLHQSYL